VLGITWAGKSLLLAVPAGYQALHPVIAHPPNQQQQQQQATGYQLVVLADHLASIQPLLGCIPEQGLGLMLWEENMLLVTDSSGVCGVEKLLYAADVCYVNLCFCLDVPHPCYCVLDATLQCFAG
jgi:hypothetical protein